MSKKLKMLAGLGIVVAVATAIFSLKRNMQLDVTAFEETVLKKYPGAKITSIEKTFKSDNLYVVTIMLNEKEFRLFATASGEIIEQPQQA